MVRFLKIAVVALVAIVLLGFAFANRNFVTVSFDPFASSDNAAFSIAAPLFAVAVVAAMLGVVAGAFDREHHEVVVAAAETQRAITLEVERRSLDRKSTRLNSSHRSLSRMPSSA